MKKIYLLLMICLIALCQACQNNASDESAKKLDITGTPEESSSNSNHKIGFKSVILHMKSTTMGMKQDMKMYIDNYGERQYTEVAQSMMGKTMKQYSIKDNGYVYSFNLEKKTGTKTKIDANSPDNINFKSLSKEVAEKFHLKKDGTAEILGKTCDVYQMDMVQQKMKATYYIWEGLPLKVESSIMGMKIMMETEKIETGVAIDEKLFVLPEGIVFEEKQNN